MTIDQIIMRRSSMAAPPFPFYVVQTANPQIDVFTVIGPDSPNWVRARRGVTGPIFVLNRHDNAYDEYFYSQPFQMSTQVQMPMTQGQAGFINSTKAQVNAAVQSMVHQVAQTLEAVHAVSAVMAKCECGADSINAGSHSTWCPKHQIV